MKPNIIDDKKAVTFITEKDGYISNFSQFDLQSRLGTSEKVSVEDLLQFLSFQTLNWTNSENTNVTNVSKKIRELECYISYYF